MAMKNEPFPIEKSGCSFAMLVYHRVFFWDDHCLFDSPPTTNHNLLIAGWKNTFEKNAIFWGLHQGTQVTASPWKLPDARQFMVCDAPGGESQCQKLVGFCWLSEHQKHFFVKKTSWKKKKRPTQKSFFDMYQMIQAVTQLDSPSWRSLFQLLSSGHGISLSP